MNGRIDVDLVHAVESKRLLNENRLLYLLPRTVIDVRTGNMIHPVSWIRSCLRDIQAARRPGHVVLHAANMSTSVAHMNSTATGPTGPNGTSDATHPSNFFSTTSSASTDANGQNGGGQGGMDEATAPLMSFLLNGRNATFFTTLYASEAVCLGMFR